MAENRYRVQLSKQSTEKEVLALRSQSVAVQPMEQDKLLQKKKKLRPSFISELSVLKWLQPYFTAS